LYLISLVPLLPSPHIYPLQYARSIINHVSRLVNTLYSSSTLVTHNLSLFFLPLLYKLQGS